MAKMKLVNKVKAAGQQRILNVRPDTPDIRDRYDEREKGISPISGVLDSSHFRPSRTGISR
ncbi:MAG: hypothetical protein QGG73_09555 [Candidatus Hydrogenedentes bacterium]|jgi:hypothetical protein|nr:hypothetical protein [Candidatus Hydrogenedentota bacterium]HJN07767.1 hypothetical protein [Pirellulaceae bacterium]